MRVLALLCVVFAGCAHVPECTAHGGRAWTQLRSAHFTVRTDVDEPLARKTVLQLERVHAALQLYFTASPTEPLDVVLFRNTMELNEIVHGPGLGVEGGYNDSGGRELMVLAAEGFLVDDHVSQRLLIHELAHRFSAWSRRSRTWWLMEGLAGYLEGATLDESLNTALFGSVPRDYSVLIGRWGVLPLDSLWTPPKSSGPNAVAHAYASAWFWVHFFLNAEGAAFQRFLEAIQNGAPPRDAFERQFSHLTTLQLEEKAREYARLGAYDTRFVVAPPPAKDVTAKELAPASVHASLARVAEMNAQTNEVTRQLVLGRGVDVENADVLAEWLFRTKPDAPDFDVLVTALTTKHPDDARGWYFAAMRGDADVSLERASALKPVMWQALSARALLRGDLALAEEGVRAAPWSARAVWALSTVLARHGVCERASLQYRLAKSLTDGGKLPPEEPCKP